MEICERTTADIVTLSLSGKLDGTTAKSFEEKILTRIDSGDRRFIIDVSELHYISSAGLRVILIAAKSLAGRGRRLALCSLGPRVAQVIELGEFDSLANLSIYPDRAAALVGRRCS